MKSDVCKLQQKGGGWGKRRESQRKGEVKRGRGIKINKKRKEQKKPTKNTQQTKTKKTPNPNKKNPHTPKKKPTKTSKGTWTTSGYY